MLVYEVQYCLKRRPVAVALGVESGGVIFEKVGV